MLDVMHTLIVADALGFQKMTDDTRGVIQNELRAMEGRVREYPERVKRMEKLLQDHSSSVVYIDPPKKKQAWWRKNG